MTRKRRRLTLLLLCAIGLGSATALTLSGSSNRTTAPQGHQPAAPKPAIDLEPGSQNYPLACPYWLRRFLK